MIWGWWWWVAAGLWLAPGPPPVPALESTLSDGSDSEKTVRLAVIVPVNPFHVQAPSQLQFMGLIMPNVMLAKREIERLNKLPGYTIEITSRDSNCSSIEGPLAVIELYTSTG